MQRYGGRTPLVSSRKKDDAVFSVPSGIPLIAASLKDDWGFHLMACTSSKGHLKKPAAVTGPIRNLKSGTFKSETTLFRKYGLRIRCRSGMPMKALRMVG
jgi:hypothetical protein